MEFLPVQILLSKILNYTYKYSKDLLMPLSFFSKKDSLKFALFNS